jgi:hypothetical protein
LPGAEKRIVLIIVMCLVYGSLGRRGVMNQVEQVLSGELNELLERLASSVPGGCLATITARQPTLRKRLDEMEDQLTGARTALLEGYGRWRRALEDIENLWALGACRSAAEEPLEPARSIAA